ncbi:hypothetical protein [Aeromonas phage T7-Ah]|uniref:Uncharacterized protein n=1 Tax=Aeromonas phage T7-Ah TaxID=2759196 RepID=A0A7S6HSB3_9CAUD|nr:hypothetical protein [Aeromonas phage T7-Ah]
MCFFSAPKISVPDTPTPAPLPPPVEDAPKVESVEFGGEGSKTSDLTGVKGSGTSGKESLKIKKEAKTPKPKTTGANIGLNAAR